MKINGGDNRTKALLAITSAPATGHDATDCRSGKLQSTAARCSISAIRGFPETGVTPDVMPLGCITRRLTT